MGQCKIANRPIEEEVLELKQQSGKDILVGSRSLIIQLMKLNLIDEYQLCVHPVVAGSGLPLFENINDRTILKLIKTKTFSGGAVILYYEPTNEKTTEPLTKGLAIWRLTINFSSTYTFMRIKLSYRKYFQLPIFTQQQCRLI